MDKIVFIIIMVALFSCKSNSIAQEKEGNKSKPKIEKPKFSDSQNTSIAPNTVSLIAVVQDIYKNSEVCGKNFTTSTKVKVKRIVSSGFGITNMIFPEQEITFGIMNSQANDFNSLKQNMNGDEEVFFKVRENLCPDMSTTVYEVLQFEIKN